MEITKKILDEIEIKDLREYYIYCGKMANAATKLYHELKKRRAFNGAESSEDLKKFLDDFLTNYENIINSCRT